MRSEIVERTCTNRLATGGARRVWLRGIERVRNRYLLAAAAHTLSVHSALFSGLALRRGLQQSQFDLAVAWPLALNAYLYLCIAFQLVGVVLSSLTIPGQSKSPPVGVFYARRENIGSSTGCSCTSYHGELQTRELLEVWLCKT